MLTWRTIKNKDNPFATDRDDWYSAEITANVNVRECGAGDGWGGDNVYISIRFSIIPRKSNSCHAECFPYTLLVRGTHTYLRTIEEGKEIAENIARTLLEQLNRTKEKHGH